MRRASRGWQVQLIPIVPRDKPHAHVAPVEYQCTGKRTFVTKAAAKRAAKGTAATKGGEMPNVYQCPHCGRYHVGRKPKVMHPEP